MVGDVRMDDVVRMICTMCHGIIRDRNIVLFREEDEEEDVEKE